MSNTNTEVIKLGSDSASELNKQLYCAACNEHFDEKIEVKGSNESGGYFVCPRSSHMTHYGPWGYAIDRDGVEYEYNKNGEIVPRNSKFIRFLRKNFYFLFS